jgi:hypothetical protein
MSQLTNGENAAKGHKYMRGAPQNRGEKERETQSPHNTKALANYRGSISRVPWARARAGAWVPRPVSAACRWCCGETWSAAAAAPGGT